MDSFGKIAFAGWMMTIIVSIALSILNESRHQYELGQAWSSGYRHGRTAEIFGIPFDDKDPENPWTHWQPEAPPPSQRPNH